MKTELKAHKGGFPTFLARAFDKLYHCFAPAPFVRSNARTHRLGELQKLEDRRLLSVVLGGADILVNSPLSPVQSPSSYLSGRAVAMNPNTGNFIVAWEGPGFLGLGLDLYGQRYNAAGTAQGPSFVVSTLSGGAGQHDPSVAMDRQGNFIVTWSDQPAASHWNIYARSYNAAATPQGGSILVGAAPGGDQQDPTVAMSANGTFVVAWAGHQTGHWQAYAATFHLNGSAILGPFQVNGSANHDQQAAHVAMDPAGDFVVTWSDNTLGPDNVFAQQFTSAGVGKGLISVTSNTSGPGQGASSVAMDSTGNFVVAWSSQNPGPANWDIYAEQYTSAGVGQGAFRVNTVLPDDQVYPSVAMTSGGNFTIAWASHNQDGNGWGVFGLDFSKQGTALESAEYQVNTYTQGDQEFPSVAVDDNGHQAFTWYSPTELGGGWSVYAKTNLAPAIVVSPDNLQTSEVGTSASFNVVLTTKPTRSVTINLTTSVAGQGALSTASLTFNNGNWSTAQTVIVTGLDDHLFNGDQTYQITGSAVSAASLYNGSAMTPVTVVNTEADGPPHSLIVTTAADLVDGNTSSIASLLANEGPDGHISLREAILAANNTPGLNQIYFSIGSGVQTIQVLGPLPVVTNPVIIDATTQPGFAGQPLIELDGEFAGSGASGIQISAGNSLVRGLVINRFGIDGIDVMTNGGNVIEGNYIGTDVTGSIALPNGLDGVYILNSPNNLVGGTSLAASNLISGNVDNGVRLDGISATGNVIEGNFLGTDVSGTAALGNGGDGVFVWNGASNNTVGGALPGTGNLMSGNAFYGIDIKGAGTSGNVVVGNTIGTDITGSFALGNALEGVAILGGSNNVVGGVDPADRNLISGNGGGGVVIGWSGATGNVVEGNYIGTDISGTLALGNTSDGVFIFNAGSGNTIGGAVTGAGNVISANLGQYGNGIEVEGNTCTGNVIQGNFVGTDATGTLPLGNAQVGVLLEDSPGNVVGGTSAGAANVISANAGPGVSIFGANARGNLVEGNLIGTDISGTVNLGNGAPGVLITDRGDGLSSSIGGASQNTIGGTAPGAGNEIAYNSGAGVTVLAGSDNAIRGNSIFANSNLGIDLFPLGVNANTPNNGENYPVLTAVEGTPNTITVTGNLNSVANSTVVIDFYASATTDPSGHVEGATYLGSMTVLTDAAGNAGFMSTLPVVLPANTLITATATLAGHNTSEFSVSNSVIEAALLVNPAGPLTTTEAGGTATFWLALAVQPTAPVTINLSSANPGQGALSATSVTFNSSNWMTYQAVTVTGLDDHLINGDQTYLISGSASSPDPGYDKLNLAPITITNTEADVAGFQLTRTALITSETGTSATFGVALTAAPDFPVTLNLATSVAGQGALSASSLTFDGSNWNTTQYVTVTGLDDHIVHGNQSYQITGVAVSSDVHFAGLLMTPVAVTNQEADVASISVSMNTLTTSETGTSAHFGVALTSAPLSPVIVNLATSAPGEGVLSTSSLTFDASNWNITQDVTVTGLDDHIVHGDQSYQITGLVASSDVHYAGLLMPPVTVTNQEADVASIRVSVNTLTTSEVGTSAHFGVALTSAPLSPVIVNLATSVPGQGSLSASSLVFDARNWNVIQDVAVTGMDDQIVNGDQTYQITGIGVSVDGHYNRLAFTPITVVNQEADVAGITATQATALVLSGTGDTATFALALTSKPQGTVTVALSTSDPLTTMVSQSILTFTPSNWNTALPVTITALAGSNTGSPALDNISVKAASSTDPVYAGLKGPVIPITILATAPVTSPVPPPTGTTPTMTTQIPGDLLQSPQTVYASQSAASSASSDADSIAAARRDDSINAALAFVLGHKTDRADSTSLTSAGLMGATDLTAGKGQIFVSMSFASATANDLLKTAVVTSAARPGPAIDLPLDQNRLAPLVGNTNLRGDVGAVRPQQTLLWNQMDRAAEQFSSPEVFSEIGPVALTGLVATSGYVLLNTRAGYWLLSLLTSRPLWKQFDPLEVLFAWEREAPTVGEGAEENEETLLSLVE